MPSKTKDPLVTKSVLEKNIKSLEIRFKKALETNNLKLQKKIREEFKKEMEINNKILEFNLNERMNEKFEQQNQFLLKFQNQMMDRFDDMAGEIKASREERVVSGSRISTNSQRIDKLEKKVFGSIQIP